mgnify:CR=1 FL=1
MRITARHVIPVGKRSLAIVIPKKWATYLGLRKGDKVVIRLDRDGSLLIRPITSPSRVSREDSSINEKREETENICINVNEIPRNEKITTKELLSTYILGIGCVKPELYKRLRELVASFSRGEEIDTESFVAKALDHVEDAVASLGRFVRDFDEGCAKRIHEIEDEMDLLYYLFMRISALRLIEDLDKSIEIKDVVWHMINAVLIKSLEDLVDSIDRLLWRIYETKIFSKELVEIAIGIEDLVQEVISCVRYTCNSDEIRDHYNKLLSIKKKLREKMISSPQSMAPALAEVESIINSIEDLIEINLIRSVKRYVEKNNQIKGSVV